MIKDKAKDLNLQFSINSSSIFSLEKMINPNPDITKMEPIDFNSSGLSFRPGKIYSDKKIRGTVNIQINKPGNLNPFESNLSVFIM
jgi:hypothetical protein